MNKRLKILMAVLAIAVVGMFWLPNQPVRAGPGEWLSTDYNGRYMYDAEWESGQLADINEDDDDYISYYPEYAYSEGFNHYYELNITWLLKGVDNVTSETKPATPVCVKYDLDIGIAYYLWPFGWLPDTTATAVCRGLGQDLTVYYVDDQTPTATMTSTSNIYANLTYLWTWHKIDAENNIWIGRMRVNIYIKTCHAGVNNPYLHLIIFDWVEGSAYGDYL